MSLKKSKLIFANNSFYSVVTDDNWAVNGTSIYNLNEGNVGINNINPEFKLDMLGQAIIRTPLVKIGVDAGICNQGIGSVAIGTQAGQFNQDTSSVAIGFQAAQSNQKANSIAIGFQAGQFNQDVSSVAIGTQAAQFSQGVSAIAIGTQAGQCNQLQNAIALGENAGQFSQGLGSIAIGYQSGQLNQGAFGLAIGWQAGQSNQSVQAISIGTQAGQSNQNPQAISIGTQAGQINQQSNAIAIGSQTGQSNQGSGSICIGTLANSTFQNSIVLNASGNSFLSDTSNAFYVRPIDTSNGVNNFLVYNSSTGKISYNTNSTKTFVINHPQNENKYLVHACLEGPEAGVYYRGEAEITNDEFIEIELPEYTKSFSNMTTHITPMDKYNEYYCIVSENKVRVYGSNGRFSWYVFANRENIDTEPFKNNVNVNGDGPYKFIITN